MSGLRQAPAFWWRERPSALARLLQPVSAIYGAITARRMARAPKGRIDAPVICIGNFVAGGTGKTPFALALADLLAQKGRNPAFLLRGYGGNARGPLLVLLPFWVLVLPFSLSASRGRDRSGSRRRRRRVY